MVSSKTRTYVRHPITVLSASRRLTQSLTPAHVHRYTTSAACGPFGESSKMCFNFDFARDWSNPVPWYNKFTHVTDANLKVRAASFNFSLGF